MEPPLDRNKWLARRSRLIDQTRELAADVDNVTGRQNEDPDRWSYWTDELASRELEPGCWDCGSTDSVLAPGGRCFDCLDREEWRKNQLRRGTADTGKPNPYYLLDLKRDKEVERAASRLSFNPTSRRARDELILREEVIAKPGPCEVYVEPVYPCEWTDQLATEHKRMQDLPLSPFGCPVVRQILKPEAWEQHQRIRGLSVKEFEPVTRPSTQAELWLRNPINRQAAFEAATYYE